MARKRRDELVELRLTPRERDLVLKHTFAEDAIAEQLRSMAAGHTEDAKVLATPSDLDDFLGAIANALNHCEDPKLSSSLDRLYARLETLEREVQARVNSAAAGAWTDGLCRAAEAGNTGDEGYVLQFRIELLGIDPPVWRRIQVPAELSLWDLHVAIQDAMGWLNCHLHVFAFLGTSRRIGIPFDDEPGAIAPGWEHPVDRYLDHGAPLALYEYDFGDSWLHEVRFEGVSRKVARRKYPRCLAGARHGPPEDCGGIGGYAEFLRAMADPKHPEHASFLDWVGGTFDPEAFDAKKVRFSDPQLRLRQTLDG